MLSKFRFPRITAALAGLWLVTALVIPLPYVVESPGPTTDVLSTFQVKKLAVPYISISGRKTYPSDGQLHLTTVSVTRPDFAVRAMYIIPSWIAPASVVLPRESIYAPQKSIAVVKQEESAAMTSSQQSGTIAALSYLSIPVTLKVIVSGFADGSGASFVLKKGDQIVGVNTIAVKRVADIKNYLKLIGIGEQVQVRFVRNGTKMDGRISIMRGAQGNSILGIMAREIPVYPFEVKINAGDIGGPSAGLMFALGIIEKLTPGSMTAGRVIAGTGTISTIGNVGAIGGIDEKIRGAEKTRAKIFLAPQPNCSKITYHPKGMKITCVKNVAEAVAALSVVAR